MKSLENSCETYDKTLVLREQNVFRAKFWWNKFEVTREILKMIASNFII